MELSSHSSKGMQKKYFENGNWYKEDFFGGEAEAEVIISKMLLDLGFVNAVQYYLKNSYTCYSKDFTDGGSFITFNRLLKIKGISDKEIKMVLKSSPETRLDWIVKQYVDLGFLENQVKKEFAILFEIDRLVLNTDRHWNNFGYVKFPNGESKLLFLFDFGTSLGIGNYKVDKASTTLNTMRLLDMKSKSRTISTSFDKQCKALPISNYRTEPLQFSPEFLRWLEKRQSVEAKRLRLRIRLLYKQ